MIPQKSIVGHNPDKKLYGDCFRTVIASILEISPRVVPHFFHDGDAEAGYAWADVWLSKNYGLRYVETHYFGLTLFDFTQRIAMNYPDTYLIVGGSTRSGIDHVVVMLNGKIVADPSLANSGIYDVTSGGFYSVGFLVSDKHAANS